MPTPRCCSRRWAARWRRRIGAARCRSPITSGPAPAAVHLAVKSDWSLKPIYDVIAMMKGSTYPDQWVVRGNHHDGWVFGASDPLSGQVALLAEAKAIGDLVKRAGGPSARIVYTSWDGEEPMLLGSTEWAETHAERAEAEGGALYQLRHQRPRLSGRRRQPRLPASGQPGRRRRDRSRDRRSDRPAAARENARRCARSPTPRSTSRPRPRSRPIRTRISRSRRWVRARTIQPFSSIWASRARPRFRRRRRQRRRLSLALRHLRASQPLRRSGLRL